MVRSIRGAAVVIALVVSSVVHAQAPAAPMPVEVPPAVVAPGAVVAPAAVPAGQWVFTQQYGWVFMPYGDGFVSVASPSAPSMYVYSAPVGWRWVAAPWVLGTGPSVWFGTGGGVRFGWYAHPVAWRTRWVRPVVIHRPVYVARPHGWGGHGGWHHGRH